MAKFDTLYKLMILYMLKDASFPMTYSKISDFMVGKEYAHFFSLQSSLAEALESGLIHEDVIRTTHYYSITPEGEETLQFFREDIPQAIREDISSYLKENRLEMINEISTISDYYRNTTGSYSARCTIREHNENLLELTLTVPDESQAKAICEKWKEKSQEVYEAITGSLMRN
ncbi:MAG: DUF4364 family protein [Lachnospiraceae bacterium]|nr:DUF4364 family protein [Lachnospiraceae bacterium]